MLELTAYMVLRLSSPNRWSRSSVSVFKFVTMGKRGTHHIFWCEHRQPVRIASYETMIFCSPCIVEIHLIFVMKKYTRRYLYLMFWPRGWSIYKKHFWASASLETCVPGGSYFVYSVFLSVTLACSMHSPESLFPDLQQPY